MVSREPRDEVTKIIIDPSGQFGDVTITAKPLTFDLDESKIIDGIAAAVAKAIVAEINAAAGDKWNKTGVLVNGIRAQASGKDYVVTVPRDRLQRDEVREKFFADIVAARKPLTPKAVQSAIGEAIADMIKVAK